MSDSPCQEMWASRADLEAASDCLTGLTDDQKDDIITQASLVLYILLGRQFGGECTSTVRPTSEIAHRGLPASVNYVGVPWVLDGPVFTHFVDAIPLQFPVISVDEVKVDGVVLDASHYTVMDQQYLVRLDVDGGRCWPISNDLSKPTTEIGTWEITYTHGFAIPIDVKDAVIEMACDIAKGIAGRSSALPANATTVSRRGVNVNLQRAVDGAKDSGTLLPSVSKVIATYNPTMERMPAFFWSPEVGTTLHSFG